jgi:hypothetical protein
MWNYGLDTFKRIYLFINLFPKGEIKERWTEYSIYRYFFTNNTMLLVRIEFIP